LEARLARAEADVARDERLLPKGAASQKDLDTAIANRVEACAGIQSTQAAVDRAALDLEFTNVTAPIGGRISRYLVTEGNLVTMNNTLLTTNRLVPFCMCTDPELARVGRNETEAQRDGIEYRVATIRTADVLRTRTASESRGFMKMLIGANRDEILGFTAFGFEASEPMAAVQTAMLGRMPYTMLRDAIFTHPTMSEGPIGLLASIPEKSEQRSA